MMLSGAGNFVNSVLNGRESPRISLDLPKLRCFRLSTAPSDRIESFTTLLFANKLTGCRIL